METYYRYAAMVEHYRRAYFDLFNAPDRFGVERFANRSEPWLAVATPITTWPRAGPSIRRGGIC
jgi:hypothetical protein